MSITIDSTIYGITKSIVLLPKHATSQVYTVKYRSTITELVVS